MKKVTCKVCGNAWYMHEQDISKIHVCPFCTESMYIPETLTPTGKALRETIAVLGVDDSARRPLRVIGYLQDIFPPKSKELKILSKALQPEYSPLLEKIFRGDLYPSIPILEERLKEDEGLSQNWCDHIKEILSDLGKEERIFNGIIGEIEKENPTEFKKHIETNRKREVKTVINPPLSYDDLLSKALSNEKKGFIPLALQYYEKAILIKQEPSVLKHLASLYASGNRDNSKAKRYYSKAAALGDKESQKIISSFK